MTNWHIWLSYITLDENWEQQKQVYCTDKSTDTRLAQYVFPEDPTNIQ